MTGEKKALAIASRLGGAAFQVYFRLSEADHKKPETVAEQLKKEFIKVETDTGVAMVEINNRTMKEGKSPAQFAHEIGRLAKLAYPGFEEFALSTVTRDTFIRDYQRN